MLIAALPALLAQNASAAHYGTEVRSAPATLTLEISDHAPACVESPTCISTTGGIRRFPVAAGDVITIDWTQQPQLLDGTLETSHLYLPLYAGQATSVTPITFELEGAEAPLALIVTYAGTRHHVPMTHDAWTPVTVYNPEARVIYVRLDDSSGSPSASRPAN